MQEDTPRAISGPKGWRIVFVSSQVSQSLWSLPLDLNAAKALTLRPHGGTASQLLHGVYW